MNKRFKIVGWGIINGDEPDMCCGLCGKNISDASEEKNRVMIAGEATDYEMVPCCSECAKQAKKDRVSDSIAKERN